MTFERKFNLSGHALALVGVVAVATTREVGAVYVLLAVASLLWSTWRSWQERGFELGPRAANVVTLAALALIIFPVIFRDAPPVQAIAEFLLVLSALKGLVAKTNRDWLQICALSFFQLVSASALTVEPVFAALFLAYLLLAPWVLVLFLLRREVSEHGDPRRLTTEGFVDSSLFRGVAGVTVILFVSTLVVFILFPRMGAGFFANPLPTGTGLTGFSDQVGLGDVTALKKDGSVALRVTVDRPEDLMTRPRYWRGAALDTFDGRRWTRGSQFPRPLPRADSGLFLANEGVMPRTLLREEIILEPMDSPVLFVLGRPLQVRGAFSGLLMDGLGNLRSLAASGARIRYEVLASLGPRQDRPSARSRELPSIDPRVAAAARERVSGIADDEARAETLLAYFAHGFSYTMEPGDPGLEDPIAHFLFESRRGHCEYFASALAVMLRAVGIPSLVVNGYLGGEWNPYGGYLLLRQSDAHSWVEAYVGGEWRTLDPTPSSGAGPARRGSGGLAALLDAYRMRWYRYVINYDLRDQVEIALSLRASSDRLRRSFSVEAWRQGWRRWVAGESGSPLLGAIAVALAAFGLSVYRRRRQRSAAAGSLSWASVRYVAMLRLLERRGLAKRPAETPDEFYRKIAPALDGDDEAIARITTLYQEARFSGHADGEAGARVEIDSLMAGLEQRN